MSILDSLKEFENNINEDDIPQITGYGKINYGDTNAVKEDVSRVQADLPPRYYPYMDQGFTSTTSYWYTPSVAWNALGDEYIVIDNEPKLDPNKIFNTDLNALKTLAADQNKIVKMFEKKLIESLTDRGKFGLNEEDIEAMSALTAARSAITSIQKEQISIRKNIADIRLKQSQVSKANAVAANDGGNAMGGSSMSSGDIGRSILDNIFDIGNTTPVMPQNSGQSYQTFDPTSASNVLDDIIGNVDNKNVQFESNDPKTYVVVGTSDNDVDFVTYGADGSELIDYPNPTSKITTIDRDAMTATDDLLVSYPVKFKYE